MGGIEAIFDKWPLIIGGLIIIYLTGGFRFISHNPAMILFLLLAVLILGAAGGKK